MSFMTASSRKPMKATIWPTPTPARDGGKGTETIGDIGERKTGVVNVSGKTDSGLLDEVSSDGEHTDASVLDLDVTETVELLLVLAIFNQAKGIEESKRSLGTELTFEGLQGGGGGSLLDRGKGDGRGDERRYDDNRLHFGLILRLTEL
jgi:hypothetical protein